MNKLLDKFSYAEMLNDASSVRTLSAYINRDVIDVKHEKVLKCETIVWRKSIEEADVNKKLIESVRQIYPTGSVIVGHHNLSAFDLEDELQLLTQVKSLLLMPKIGKEKGIFVKMIDGELKAFQIYPRSVEYKLEKNYLKTKILGETVVLRVANSKGLQLPINQVAC